ncbi:MAG: iron-sulfur cluster insertion protein ErpA [Parvibaculaceae bacterium]
MSETPTLELPGEGQPITLSDRAAKRIAEITQGEGDGVVLRVAVNGGGCSGFQYSFTLDDTRQDDDLVLEKHGATVLIDSVSQMYMGGSEIDFADDLIGQAFKINNPNATANCGCGTSFSV